jgi:NitT/TauT family transport system substrate-binding protein
MTRLLTGLITLVALVAGAVAVHAQNVERKDVKISLDWAFQGPQSIFLYGLERGRFQKEGLNVTIDRGSGSADTITRVASGAYDFGWADLATMTKFNAQNPDKELLAVYITGDNSPLAIVTVEGRGIKTPKDLEGKKLGATAGSAALALFDAFAEKAGIDPKKIAWQQISGQLREPMMVRGDLDAVAGFTTSSIMSVVDLGVPLQQVVVLRYNDFGVKQYGTAIFARPDFVKTNPMTVAAVVRAVNNALKDAIADPKASVKTILARDPLVNLDTECIRLFDGLETLTLTQHFRTEGLSSVDNARMKSSIDETLAAFQIKADVPIEKVFTAAFLPPIAERIPPQPGSCK